MAEIKGCFALAGGFLGWFFGGIDSFLLLLILFVSLDYFTGVLAAGIGGTVSSKIGLRGIAKKLLIFILVGVGNALDTVLLGEGEPIRTAVIFFYLSNEGISILENASKMGVPIPRILEKAIGGLKEDDEDKSIRK